MKLSTYLMFKCLVLFVCITILSEVYVIGDYQFYIDILFVC
jgi:hypothetical protein